VNFAGLCFHLFLVPRNEGGCSLWPVACGPGGCHGRRVQMIGGWGGVGLNSTRSSLQTHVHSDAYIHAAVFGSLRSRV
jgi:hypothetical protein